MSERVKKWYVPVAYLWALLALFLSGPPILLVLQRIYHFDWSELSDIGQSFTGVSALLSAAALAAVAVSIRMQAREVRLSHATAVYGFQRELIGMALEESDYLACLGSDGLPVDEKKFRIYNTLWLRYYELAFESTNLSPTRIVYALKHERFCNSIVRQHWVSVRENWRDTTNPAFVALVDQAYDAALQAQERESTRESIGQTEDGS
jgi:Family of unknown function (DUF6082)